MAVERRVVTAALLAGLVCRLEQRTRDIEANAADERPKGLDPQRGSKYEKQIRVRKVLRRQLEEARGQRLHSPSH